MPAPGGAQNNAQRGVTHKVAALGLAMGKYILDTEGRAYLRPRGGPLSLSSARHAKTAKLIADHASRTSKNRGKASIGPPFIYP